MRRGLYSNGMDQWWGFIVHSLNRREAVWYSEDGEINWVEEQGKIGRRVSYDKDFILLPEEFLL